VLAVGRYGAAVQTDDVDGLTGRATSAAVSDLVDRALNGDEAAWNEIVDRYAGLVWSVVRGFRLDHAAASDVAQTVWLRLVQGMDTLRDPNRLAGWLATTARRECLRTLRGAGRELPSDDLLDRAGSAPAATAPEQHLLREEYQRELWRAVASLPDRCQILLRTMAYDPDHSYAQISAALAMPVGSIGPTRARCLTKLRELLERGATTQGGRLDDH